MAVFAYAALVSLMNTITMEQRPRYHPHRQIFVDDGGLMEALLERVYFLVGFLEKSGWKGVAKTLEERIVEVAYAAEDAIESHVVDQVLPRGDTSPGNNGSDQILRQALKKIVQDMDFIKNEVMLLMKEQSEVKDEHLRSSGPADSSTAPRQRKKSTMVGFENEKKQIKNELTGSNSERKIISVVGMGGSGKTTLVRNIFDDIFIVEHFDFRIWATVSDDYNITKILRVFCDLKQDVNDEMDNATLGEEVYKRLFSRRYLVVLDDVWDKDAWYEIQRFFPQDNNGSRIIITTRHSNLAKELSNFTVEMESLDEENSWNLFCDKVFQQSSCPLELEGVAKKIAQNCRGLPLAIVVIGGLLAKLNKDKPYWEFFAEQSSHAIYLAMDQHYSNLLSLSYELLPVHLKLCFLYMGVFPEDYEICVSELINLWIAEGFLKSIEGKNLEEVAENYVKDLIERNFLTVHHWGSSGEKEYCTIHDLLRELCLREAQKCKFFCIVTSQGHLDLPSMNHQRRIAILLSGSKTKEYPQIIDSLLSTSNLHSLIVYGNDELLKVLESPVSRLLRVFFMIDDCNGPEHKFHSEVSFNAVNLRYLSCSADSMFMHTLASYIRLIGNLQVLAMRNFLHSIEGPSEIWNLPQLRHVEFDIISLPKPPFSEQERHDYAILEYLQTLQKLLNLRFEEGIINKISTIKKLNVWYNAKFQGNKGLSYYNFRNIGRLQKLESFECCFFHPPNPNELVQNMSFPSSLQKLALTNCRLLWKDMSVIGLLPLLTVLELKYDSFRGPYWYPMKGEFLSLKYLSVQCCGDLVDWNADCIHFPCLEHLVLHSLEGLEEVPLGIGDLETLGLIELNQCSDSAVCSAKKIVEKQLKLGNDEFLVKVTLGKRSKLSRSNLESKNFQVDATYQNMEHLEDGSDDELPVEV